MKIINIKFFITHKELIELIEELRNSYKLHIGFIYKSDTSFTFNIEVFKEGDNINYKKILKDTQTIAMSLGKFNLDNTERPHLFLENNLNILEIDVGEQTDLSLKESWMYSLKKLENEDSFKLWNKIARKLKKETISGGYSVFEITGKKSYEKTLRYTDKSKEMFENGLKILPSSGKNIHFELTKEN